MNTLEIVKELKNNHEDYEFYPTSKEMIKVIYNDTKGGSWLDIGCGMCHFKKWYNEFYKEDYERKVKQDEIWQNNGYKDEYRWVGESPSGISTYYVIEKADTFLKYFDKDTICLGRDFYATELMDKPVSHIFCNPPYSEYDKWVEKVLMTGNFKTAYFVIPQRWKDNDLIQEALRVTHIKSYVLDSCSFEHGERQARTFVDIVKFERDRYYSEGYREDAFDKFCNEFFTFKKEKSWEDERNEIEQKKNELVSANPKDRLKLLCDMYKKDFDELNKHFMAIADLDFEILQTIGVDARKVKEALKQQRDGLKIKYWNLLFDQLEEITDRLTSTTCNKLFNKFSNINTVEFSVETVYPIVLWIIQNANKYYDEQLLDFFDNLTQPDNISNYKSNIKVFKRNEWRPEEFDKEEEVTHYTLHYRIVCSKSLFYDYYNRGKEYKYYGSEHLKIMRNIATIARNLGFSVDKKSIEDNGGLQRGQKGYVLQENGKPLFEYKYYDNGNKHIKFNVELMKAINVNVARLRNWIQTTADIEKEFEPEMAKGAEKYFKSNFTFLPNSLKLLTVS